MIKAALSQRQSLLAKMIIITGIKKNVLSFFCVSWHTKKDLFCSAYSMPQVLTTQMLL